MKHPSIIALALATAVAAPVYAQTTVTPAPADRTSPAEGTPRGPATGAATMPGAEGGARTMNSANDEKTRLESVLSTAQSREDYPKLLKQEGFEIAAVNDDKPKYVEYEVVKGKQTYEVRMEFDEGAPKAKKIDVASNMIKDGKTKEMMRGASGSDGAATTGRMSPGATMPGTTTPGGATTGGSGTTGR